eukprot:scaffold56961_cov26-Tisochrysis_lutea.AAC.3
MRPAKSALPVPSAAATARKARLCRAWARNTGRDASMSEHNSSSARLPEPSARWDIAAAPVEPHSGMSPGVIGNKSSRRCACQMRGKSAAAARRWPSRVRYGTSGSDVASPSRCTASADQTELEQKSARAEATSEGWAAI